MAFSLRDRALGMDRPITRRDFLNGVALGLGAAASFGLPGFATGADASAPQGYPPRLAGLRGHSETAMTVMHAVRDGTFWGNAGTPEASGERYDLVVVGGGISGLAAALFYKQQTGPGTRILILENNDDFGGHARRDEFTTAEGRTVIGYGGSQSLQTPSYFSPLVTKLLADIGIEPQRFETFYDQGWHEKHGLGDAIFFAKEVYGVDALVRTTETAADWVPNTPLNDKAKRDLIELIDASQDYLAGKSREEKVAVLAATTYADFLTKICGYDPQLVTFFQDSTEDYFGIGIDGTTALDAWGNWNPGFDAMDLGEKPFAPMSPSGRLVRADPDPYIYHFPDGNAGVARALVRALIPAAVPGSTMEDLATGTVDYAALDVADSAVRLRLNASVVRLAHDGPLESATAVTLTYVEDGVLKTVEAGQAILACWHRVIPHIAPELAADQVAALNDQVKIPLIYTNVLLNNWRALDTLKIAGFEAPSSFWRGAEIDFPVSMGGYQFAQTPDDPIILHLAKMPLSRVAGQSAREQAAAGRQAMMDMSFEQMEREIRDMLGRALGEGGFDPARDIAAITCNRWSHGYALEYMRPWDQFWPDGPLPVVAARKPFGRVAIANSDSGAYAYVHSAVDQAGRAVSELLGDKANLDAWSDFPGPPVGELGL